MSSELHASPLQEVENMTYVPSLLLNDTPSTPPPPLPQPSLQNNSSPAGGAWAEALITSESATRTPPAPHPLAESRTVSEIVSMASSSNREMTASSILNTYEPAAPPQQAPLSSQPTSSISNNRRSNNARQRSNNEGSGAAGLQPSGAATSNSNNNNTTINTRTSSSWLQDVRQSINVRVSEARTAAVGMVHAARHRPMQTHDDLTMSPFQKLRHYGRFPCKMVLNLLIIILITLLTCLYEIDNAIADEQERKRLVSLFMSAVSVPGAANQLSPGPDYTFTPTLSLNTQDQVLQAMRAVGELYYNITHKTIVDFDFIFNDAFTGFSPTSSSQFSVTRGDRGRGGGTSSLLSIPVQTVRDMAEAAAKFSSSASSASPATALDDIIRASPPPLPRTGASARKEQQHEKRGSFSRFFSPNKDGPATATPNDELGLHTEQETAEGNGGDRDHDRKVSRIYFPAAQSNTVAERVAHTFYDYVRDEFKAGAIRNPYTINDTWVLPPVMTVWMLRASPRVDWSAASNPALPVTYHLPISDLLGPFDASKVTSITPRGEQTSWVPTICAPKPDPIFSGMYFLPCRSAQAGQGSAAPTPFGIFDSASRAQISMTIHQLCSTTNAKSSSSIGGLFFATSIYLWDIAVNFDLDTNGLVTVTIEVDNHVKRSSPRLETAFVMSIMLLVFSLWDGALRLRSISNIRHLKGLIRRRLRRLRRDRIRMEWLKKQDAHTEAVDAIRGLVQTAATPRGPREGPNAWAPNQALSSANNFVTNTINRNSFAGGSFGGGGTGTAGSALAVGQLGRTHSTRSLRSEDNGSATDDDEHTALIFTRRSHAGPRPRAGGVGGVVTGTSKGIAGWWYRARRMFRTKRRSAASFVRDLFGMERRQRRTMSQSAASVVGRAGLADESSTRRRNHSHMHAHVTHGAHHHAHSHAGGQPPIMTRASAQQREVLLKAAERRWRRSLHADVGLSWQLLALTGDALAITYVLFSVVQAASVSVSQSATRVERMILGIAGLFSATMFVSNFRFFPRLYFMIRATRAAFPRVALFFAGVVPLFCGFAIFFATVFGSYSNGQFASVFRAGTALYCAMFGDTLLPSFQAAMNNDAYEIYFLGAVMCFVFIAFFIFAVLNLALAIVIDAYEKVKDEYGLSVGDRKMAHLRHGTRGELVYQAVQVVQRQAMREIEEQLCLIESTLPPSSSTATAPAGGMGPGSGSGDMTAPPPTIMVTTSMGSFDSPEDGGGASSKRASRRRARKNMANTSTESSSAMPSGILEDRTDSHAPDDDVPSAMPVLSVDPPVVGDEPLRGAPPTAERPPPTTHSAQPSTSDSAQSMATIPRLAFSGSGHGSHSSSTPDEAARDDGSGLPLASPPPPSHHAASGNDPAFLRSGHTDDTDSMTRRTRSLPALRSTRPGDHAFNGAATANHAPPSPLTSRRPASGSQLHHHSHHHPPGPAPTTYSEGIMTSDHANHHRVLFNRQFGGMLLEPDLTPGDFEELLEDFTSSSEEDSTEYTDDDSATPAAYSQAQSDSDSEH